MAKAKEESLVLTGKELTIAQAKDMVEKSVLGLLREEYQFLKDTTDALEIKDDETMKNAGDFRIKVKKFLDGIEDKRREIVDPFTKAKKYFDGKFNAAYDAFDNIIKNLDGKIKPYLTEVARKKEEAARRAREAELAEMERKKQEAAKLAKETEQEVFVDMTANIAKEQDKLAQEQIVVHKSVKSEDTSTTQIDNWKARIVNADLVPRMYCQPDEKVLNKLAKERSEEIKAGMIKIAGVEFWNDSYISSRNR